MTSPCSYCRFEWASFSPSVAALWISLIFGCVRIPFVLSSLFKNNLEVWSAGGVGRVDSNRASFIIVNSILTVNLFNMGNKNITLIVRDSRPTMEGTHVGFFSLLFPKRFLPCEDFWSGVQALAAACNTSYTGLYLQKCVQKIYLTVCAMWALWDVFFMA